jgi:biopolymer transport protein ExbD
MAQKKRLLDVWITQLNTVYREVPFVVATDWLQEGRLLAEDKVRITGTTAWRLIGKVPAFAPYLPKAEPFRAEDQAEALEPVEVGFDWKNPAETEDEDVDMIPLIDISLVLLIFFMMTASVSSGFFSPIKTPAAQHQLAAITKDMFWIGIDKKNQEGVVEKGADGQPVPWYSLGKETKSLHASSLDLAEVLAALEKTLADTAGEVRLRIRADQDLPITLITAATLEVQDLEVRINRRRDQEKNLGRLNIVVSGEVSEPKGK